MIGSAMESELTSRSQGYRLILLNHVQTFSDEISRENVLELHRQHVLKSPTV